MKAKSKSSSFADVPVKGGGKLTDYKAKSPPFPPKPKQSPPKLRKSGKLPEVTNPLVGEAPDWAVKLLDSSPSENFSGGTPPSENFSNIQASPDNSPSPSPQEKRVPDPVSSNKYVELYNRVKSGKRKAVADTIRDISEVQPWMHFKPINFNKINWERRLACKADPILDLRTYMPNVFYMEWSDFHIALIRDIESCIQSGGKKAVALPRASGKTAICRGMIQRAMKYALRRFCFFIGSKEDKAIQTLDAIKAFWLTSPLLLQDFPELAYPVYRLEGRATGGMSGQLYKQHRTYVDWSSSELRTPTLMLTEEDAASYLKHDPDCVMYLPDHNRFIVKSSGILVRVSGIDGSIRGEADVNPVLLTQPRPDLILLDDIQKDQTANSPKSCEDLITLIESAISHLSAPDIVQACLMPCTVIREGDVSDIYLTPEMKPDWAGERWGLIRRFPPGITYDDIYEEINGQPNIQGQLWTKYKAIREQSLREHRSLKLANEFYKENQAVMDAGFEVTWPDRYLKSSSDPDRNEISAIQSVMNWRFTDHAAYLSEGENRPKIKSNTDSVTVTAEEVKEKITNIPRGEISVQWTNLVAFIDVQDELLFYNVFAHDADFNGQFIDYGTWPDTRNINSFRKNQIQGWSLLTRAYYRDPRNKTAEGAPANINRNRTTKIRAPFDAKIYYSLKKACDHLLSREYLTRDESHSPRKIRALAIDTKWGDAANVIKQFVREYNSQQVMCYEGAPFQPSYKQLEAWNPTPGWLFEHQQFPHLTESRWVIKPYNKSTYQQRYILSDVNRWKSFLMKRLATPIGNQGSITLFHAQPYQHSMFAMHICSEHPTEVIANGFKKDCWQSKPGMVGENDYLDCSVGCMCLASICGASIKHQEQRPTKRKTLKQVYEEQRSKLPNPAMATTGEIVAAQATPTITIGRHGRQT